MARGGYIIIGRKGNGKGKGFDCIPNGKGGYDILNGEGDGHEQVMLPELGHAEDAEDDEKCVSTES